MSDELDDLFGAFVIDVSTRIHASLQSVWDLITDVARMSEFSPELVEAHWVDPNLAAPVVGARFTGTNDLGGFEWARICTVTAAREPEVFAYVVGDRFDGTRTGEWRFVLEQDGDDTILHQRFSHAPGGRSGTRLLADQDPGNARSIVDVRRDVLQRGMTATLEEIKKTIEEK